MWGRAGLGLGGEVARLQLRCAALQAGAAASATSRLLPGTSAAGCHICALDAPSSGSSVFTGVETLASEEGSERRTLPLRVQSCWGTWRSPGGPSPSLWG